MARYLLRRLALTIPILLGVSLLVFLMLHSAGGDPAQTILGARADPESIAALRHELGLARPVDGGRPRRSRGDYASGSDDAGRTGRPPDECGLRAVLRRRQDARHAQ